MKHTYLKKFTSILLTLVLLGTTGQGFVFAEESTSQTATNNTDNSSTPATDTTVNEYHSAMVERSLVSVGNNKRIKAAIEKAKSGKEVTLAYLGGSITQGIGADPMDTKCYAYLATQVFTDKYVKDKTKVNYVNAGISGTPSTLGILRCDQDIISKNPDIVFVEFAVNDGTDNNSRIIYESLVKKLLSSKSSPAVVLIFTVLKNGYTAQEHMSQIGAHYDLGMISIKDAITPEIDAGRMSFLNDYAADDAHPNNQGHALVAEFIGNYFDKAYEKVTDEGYTIPNDAVFGTDYAGIKNITDSSSALKANGSFPLKKLTCFTYTNGWQKPNNSKNDPMKLTLTCSKLIISFKQVTNKSFGNAEVYVDGKLVATLKGYLSTAWGNIVTNIVYNTTTAAKHKIEIKMAKGDESKSFIILGIGYVK